MKYIKEIKQYIHENISKIEINEHNVHKKFFVSDSKLSKDFKKVEGITIREFMIQEKLDLAHQLKKRIQS